MDPQASDLRLAGVYTLKLESRSGARAKLVSAWVSVRTSSLIPLLATDAISGGGGTDSFLLMLPGNSSHRRGHRRLDTR